MGEEIAKGNWKALRTDAYKLTYNFTEKLPKAPHFISFLVGEKEKFDFRVVTKDELSAESPKIDPKQLLEFLQRLGQNLIPFLVNEIGVKESYLYDFYLIDFQETLRSLLTDPIVNPSLRFEYPHYDHLIFGIEITLRSSCDELESFAASSLQRTDDKVERVIAIGSQKFETLFGHDSANRAKSGVLNSIGFTTCDSSLRRENIKILSDILMFIEYAKLLEHMRNAFENPFYGLRLSQMSDEMQKIFVDPGDLVQTENVENITNGAVGFYDSDESMQLGINPRSASVSNQPTSEFYPQQFLQRSGNGAYFQNRSFPSQILPQWGPEFQRDQIVSALSHDRRLGYEDISITEMNNFFPR